jgi:hypothetical protein
MSKFGTSITREISGHLQNKNLLNANINRQESQM